MTIGFEDYAPPPPRATQMDGAVEAAAVIMDLEETTAAVVGKLIDCCSPPLQFRYILD